MAAVSSATATARTATEARRFLGVRRAPCANCIASEGDPVVSPRFRAARTLRLGDRLFGGDGGAGAE